MPTTAEDSKFMNFISAAVARVGGLLNVKSMAERFGAFDRENLIVPVRMI